jgi:hypothetical protein
MRFWWDQSDAKVRFQIYTTAGGGTPVVTVEKALTPVAGTAYHLAVIRGWGGNANDWVITANGVAGSTVTDSDGWPAGNYAGVFTVGCLWDHATARSMFVDGQLDEIRLLKGEAYWTAAFTPPTLAYIKDARELLVGSTRRLSGIKLTVATGGANQKATSALTGKEWTGGGWSSLSITDGTASGGSSGKVTGWVTFVSTVATSKPVYVNGYFLYFYLLRLDTGTVTLSHVSCKAPFQAITDVWDGVDRPCLSFLLYNADGTGRYLDLTTNVKEIDYLSSNTGTFANLSSYAYATQVIYAGFDEETIGINFIIPGANDLGCRAAGSLVIKRYTGQGWVSVGTVNDGSAKGGKPVNSSGTATWQQAPKGTESRISLGGGAPMHQCPD